MPWLVATMVSLSTIAPAMVLPAMEIPVLAAIVPLLTMSPIKDETRNAPCEAEPDAYAACRDRAALAVGDAAGEGGHLVEGYSSTERAADRPGIGSTRGNHARPFDPDAAAAATPEKRAWLLTPPPKFATFHTKMALFPEIVPPLLMPPAKLVTPLTKTPSLFPEIAPLLLMPPEKAVTALTTMPPLGFPKRRQC